MALETLISSHEYFPGSAMLPERIPFPFLSNDEVRVTWVDASGNEVVLIEGVSYTIAGDGSLGIGTVTAKAPYGSNDRFLIERATVAKQKAVIKPQEPFPAKAAETQLDRMTMLLQELRRDVDSLIERTWMVPRYADMAGKYSIILPGGQPGFASGTGNDPALRVDLGTADGAKFISTLQDGAPSARALLEKVNDLFSVKDFGAVGDGVHDDTVYIERAFNESVKLGKAVYFPAGAYRITRRIVINMPRPAVGPNATNFFAQIVAYGDGFSSSIILCDNCAWIRVVGSSQQHRVDIDALTVVTNTVNLYTAIELDCSAYPFFAEHTVLSRIRCEFRGSDGASLVNCWAKAIETIDWGDLDVTGSDFNGAATPNGIGFVSRVQAGLYNCKIFIGPGTKFRFLQTGYQYGNGTQSAYIHGAFFGLNQYDIDVPPGQRNHQGLSIVNCECYELGTGPFLRVRSNVPNLLVADNRLAVSAGFVSLQIDVTNQTNICNNEFFPDTAPNTAIAAISIDGSVSGSHCVISGNNAAGATVLAQLKAGSTNVHFDTTSNVWTMGMVGVVNNGTSNFIGALVPTPAGVLGYTGEAFSSVQQLTDKSTAVSVATPAMELIMNPASLAAGAEVAFTVNCDLFGDMATTTYPLVNNANYQARITDPATGSFKVRVKNVSTGPLSDAVRIRLAVVRLR